MQNNQSAAHEINALEAQASSALQTGAQDEALRYWSRILALDPNHARTLTSMGHHAFRKGDFKSARAAFQRVADTDGADPQQWVNLALVCRSLGDEAAEDAALQRALALDPSDLLSLVLRGNLLERRGNSHDAAGAYAAATIVAPPMERLHPDLRAALAHAAAYREQYDKVCAEFLDQFLAPQYRELAGAKLKRFDDSLNILVGRGRRYDSVSTSYHYPGLPAIEFPDRSEFPWLEQIEAATDDIRDEFMAVLKAEAGFEPYISYPPGTPLNQWVELNNSPSWTAFHLYKMGELVPENAARCPKTMAALKHVPQPEQPGRTPAAMFSLLKPRTTIPPHNGTTNCRLVTHLPLIVPEQCGFRVGNETRQWEPGKAWVFDDTIQHEAWNNSDKLRVILIFDVWNPWLSEAERKMVAAMTAGMNAFAATTPQVKA
jgi:aspartate beta-hydroxylase